MTNDTAFYDRTDRLAFLIAAVASLSIYLATLAPDVTLGFSGLFSTVALHGGVPHPPGYPLWTIYSWLFVHAVPFNSIGWRAALASAFAASLSCGMLALLVSRSAASVTGLLHRERSQVRLACGFSAALIFGSNAAVWKRAVVADVWPLTICMLCWFLCLMRRWLHAAAERRYLYAALTVFGLLLTNSQIMLCVSPAILVLTVVADKLLGRDVLCVSAAVLLFFVCRGVIGYFTLDFDFDWPSPFDLDAMLPITLPLAGGVTATAVYLVVKTGRLFTEWKPLLCMLSAFLLGLSLYLYVPLASATNPPVNWGYPRTLSGMIHTFGRGQYSKIEPTRNAARFAQQVTLCITTIARQFGKTFTVLALLALALSQRFPVAERRWIFALLAVFGCLTLLMAAVINADPDGAVGVFFSASYVVLAIWLGSGLAALASIIGTRGRTSDWLE